MHISFPCDADPADTVDFHTLRYTSRSHSKGLGIDIGNECVLLSPENTQKLLKWMVETYMQGKSEMDENNASEKTAPEQPKETAPEQPKETAPEQPKETVISVDRCPYCNSNDLELRSTVPTVGGSYHYVRCKRCGAQGGPQLTKQLAGTAWNMRAPESFLQGYQQGIDDAASAIEEATKEAARVTKTYTDRIRAGLQARVRQ